MSQHTCVFFAHAVRRCPVVATVAFLAALFTSAPNVFAAEKRDKDHKEKRADSRDLKPPAGTWKWSFMTSSGERVEQSLKLAVQGESLTGTHFGRNGAETAIQDGWWRGHEVTFAVVRERDGRKVTSKYRGRLDGTTLTGTIESDWNGETRTREWRAEWVVPKPRKAEGISGVWKWSTSFGNRTFDLSLRLKQDGEKVTGSLAAGRIGKTTIEDGAFKDNEVSFSVTREIQGRANTSKYKGKLEEDKIVGTVESEDRNGEMRTRDWEATRADDPPTKADVTGTWRWTLEANGQRFEPHVKLKQDADRLTGTLIWGENEAEISEGKIDEDEVTFKVSRERDGQKLVSSYHGTIDGDTLTGKIDSNWAGTEKSYDWEAKREKK